MSHHKKRSRHCMENGNACLRFQTILTKGQDLAVFVAQVPQKVVAHGSEPHNFQLESLIRKFLHSWLCSMPNGCTMFA